MRNEKNIRKLVIILRLDEILPRKAYVTWFIHGSFLVVNCYPAIFILFRVCVTVYHLLLLFLFGSLYVLFCFLSYKCYTTHQSIQTLFFSLFSFLFSLPAWWWHVQQGNRMPEHVSRGLLWFCEILLHCNVSIYLYFLDICLACERGRPLLDVIISVHGWTGMALALASASKKKKKKKAWSKVMERHMETKRSSSYKRLHITNQKDNKEKGDEKKKRKRRSWEKEKRERTAHAPMSYYLHLYLHYIFIIVLGLTQPS